MSSKIKPIFYEIKDLGKYMKSSKKYHILIFYGKNFRSKKKYVWIFEIANKKYTLELEFSLLSGKRRVFKDGVLLYETIQ